MTTPMACNQAHAALLDEQHARFDPVEGAALHDHLGVCEACSRVHAEEAALSDLLRTQLTRSAAPAALRERLVAQLAPIAIPLLTPAPSRWQRHDVRGAFGAGALLLAAAAALLLVRPHPAAEDSFVREALNDHLRVVYAENPVEIESGGQHQVKPWFTGRLDFSPDLAFSGDAEFPLVGGAVGVFIDRKAATLVFKRRLHTISCLIFRAQDLPWPSDGSTQSLERGMRAQGRSVDGFHIVLWRDGALGHVLVSDVSEADLIKLANKFAQAD